MNTRILVVSVILILAGICGVTVLAGATLGKNSTIQALPLITQTPGIFNASHFNTTVTSIAVNPSNSSLGKGTVILTPTPPFYPNIYNFEQYLQILLEGNQGSATISIIAKDGVITITSPTIGFNNAATETTNAASMSLYVTNFKAVIDKNTGITTVTADTIKYFNGSDSFQADNFKWVISEGNYTTVLQSRGGVIPPAFK